jgi:hypothetical protein
MYVLADLSTADMSVEALKDEVATLASHLNAGSCRWLELVGELDRRGDWADWGSGSCAEWLAWRCALLPRAAREHVRVARRLAELPLIHAAFANGELSYSKVRALTRVAEPECEHDLLELARTLTAAQLERAVRALRKVTTADAVDHHDNTYLSTYCDADGSLVISARLAPEDGAVFTAAIDAAQGPLWGAGSAEPPTPRLMPAEALAAVAAAALASSSERPGGERFQVVVHVDADTLSGTGDADGECAVDDGPALAPETVRRIACDSSVLALSQRRGRPVRVGRKTRAVPHRLRLALRYRDRGCRFPGCENHRFVDAHHIHHWAHGGVTDLDNLVLLCRRHHRFVHELGYCVDDKLRFFDPWGFEIPAVPKPPRGDPDELVGPGQELLAATGQSVRA